MKRIWIYALLIINKFGSRFNLHFNSNFYKLYFYFHPAIIQKGTLYVTGKLLLKIDVYSKFLLDDFVRIHSGYKENPFFGERKTLININRGATLILGKNVGISNSSIYCSEKIVIEDNVMIGGGCQIYDSNFHPVDFESRILANKNSTKNAPILIKSGAFIGGGSHICKGVTIGQRSVIASGSVVICDVPNDQIWGGNPAKFLKDVK